MDRDCWRKFTLKAVAIQKLGNPPVRQATQQARSDHSAELTGRIDPTEAPRPAAGDLAFALRVLQDDRDVEAAHRQMLDDDGGVQSAGGHDDHLAARRVVSCFGHQTTSETTAMAV